MSELKMYVAIGLSELTERTKSIGIDKLHLYKKYTNITENDLLICSLYDLPPNTPFRIYFYSVGSEVREDIIKTSMNQINFGDADSWNEVSDRYIQLLNDLETCVRKSFENVYIGINLSFGDFCLLTPNDCPHNVDEILDVIIDFLNPKPDIPEVWERDAKLALVKRKILYRLNTQHVYSYTSHNDDYKELFTSMLNANVDTTKILKYAVRRYLI